MSAPSISTMKTQTPHVPQVTQPFDSRFGVAFVSRGDSPRCCKFVLTISSIEVFRRFPSSQHSRGNNLSFLGRYYSWFGVFLLTRCAFPVDMHFLRIVSFSIFIVTTNSTVPFNRVTLLLMNPRQARGDIYGIARKFSAVQKPILPLS